MASQTAVQRLRKEFRNFSREPPAHITARPLPSNILQWYFVLEGVEGSPFSGGLYMGRLAFPPQYPYKPPAVYMCTPQGRFETNTKLCLSMSDFHPETWNPLWSVSAVLTGLLTFMLSDEDTVGSISTSANEKRALARSSHVFNRSNKVFRELFPEFLRLPSQDPTNGSAYRGAASRTVGRIQAAESKQRGVTGGHEISGSDAESLPSLLAWLVIFVGVLFAVFRLITSV